MIPVTIRQNKDKYYILTFGRKRDDLGQFDKVEDAIKAFMVTWEQGDVLYRPDYEIKIEQSAEQMIKKMSEMTEKNICKKHKSTLLIEISNSYDGKRKCNHIYYVFTLRKKKNLNKYELLLQKLLESKRSYWS